MPQRPQRPCRHCKKLHRNASGYCDEHVGLAKQWRKAPGESGRGGRPWRRLRDYILIRDGYMCQCEECKAKVLPLVATEVDHIVPKSQGGTDDHSNLRAINGDCHRRKTQAEARAGRGSGRSGAGVGGVWNRRI